MARTNNTPEDIPIQPVDDPILNTPYDEPQLYWEYDRQTGEAKKSQGRRPAEYWYKTDTGFREQGKLELFEDRKELELVNKLRKDVARWRQADYVGATNVTRELLAHWRRANRLRRFFFCQLEAVETIIFLSEMRGKKADGTRHRPRWNPEFSNPDFDKLYAFGPTGDLIETLPRFCTKDGHRLRQNGGDGHAARLVILQSFHHGERPPLLRRGAGELPEPDHS